MRADGAIARRPARSSLNGRPSASGWRAARTCSSASCKRACRSRARASRPSSDCSAWVIRCAVSADARHRRDRLVRADRPRADRSRAIRRRPAVTACPTRPSTVIRSPPPEASSASLRTSSSSLSTIAVCNWPFAGASRARACRTPERPHTALRASPPQPPAAGRPRTSGSPQRCVGSSTPPRGVELPLELRRRSGAGA